MMTRIRPRRGVLSIVLLLSAAFLFSGCVTMELESDFNEDGSDRHSMTVTIDTSMFGDLGETGELTQEFEDLDESADAEGFTVEPIEDGDIVGAKITTEVEDSSDLGAVLNSLVNAGEETASEADQMPDAATEPFSGTFQQDGDSYSLDLSVDGNALGSEGTGEMGGGDLGMDPEQFFDLSYTVTMPGELDAESTNGTVLEDGRVRWDLPMSGSQQFTAASSTDSGPNTTLFLMAGGGILILIALGLIVAGVFFFSNRGNQEPAPADEPASE